MPGPEYSPQAPEPSHSNQLKYLSAKEFFGPKGIEGFEGSELSKAALEVDRARKARVVA
jgi:hypothetical protein